MVIPEDRALCASRRRHKLPADLEVAEAGVRLRMEIRVMEKMESLPEEKRVLRLAM